MSKKKSEDQNTHGNTIAHPGERVVRGQRLMHSASVMFLRWLTGAGKGHPNLYVLQLNDVKIKP
jgi:hypothetical protein